MELISVTVPDGSTFPLRIFPARNRRADRSPGYPVVLIVVPGMGVPAGYYELFARAACARDMNVVICELRGQGDSVASSGSYGFHTIVSVDLPAAMQTVSQRFPNARRYLLGHSIGGQLATMCAAAGAEPAGLILVASGTNYHRCYGGAMASWLLLGSVYLPVRGSMTIPGRRIATARGPFDGHPYEVYLDWLRLVRSGMFRPVDAELDYEQAITELTLPTLAVHIAGDHLAPQKSIGHLLAKMPNARVTVWEESKPVGHNGWIFDCGTILDRIEIWMKETADCMSA